jgi:polysaccharide pyruvyl transferase WcaK-like protein
MRVLILWADDSSPNLGVRALGRGTAALVQSTWPDATIVYQNYGHRVRELPFGRIRSLLKERVTSELGMQRWLAEFDLIIDTRSGDSFSDIYGIHRLAVMSTVAEFARQSGVPIVLGPQTIGPFETVRGRAIARASLRGASIVMARDTASADYARSLGRGVDLTTTDVVFALPVPEVPRTRDVVLNISGLLWNENPHVDSRRYRELITGLYDRLITDGREVALLAHVVRSTDADSDVAAVEEFAQRFAPISEVIVPEGLDEVRMALASATVVVGSRMHACLNALSVGTPAIPLAYSRKFDSLMRNVGWDRTIDMRTHEDPLGATLAAIDSDDLALDAAIVGEMARELLKGARVQLASMQLAGVQ